MRFVSLLVAFCFSLNVMASTGAVHELERQMDDYHYALTVEWDQKDQQFYDQHTKAFFESMSQLIREQGLSQEEILNLVEKKMNNKAMINAIKLKLSLLKEVKTSDELATILKESSGDLYTQGASWNGGVMISSAIWIVAIAAVGYGIWWSATHKCVAYSNQYVCEGYCGGGGYSNGYGGCFSYETCGYRDVCTAYAKK